MIQRVNAQTSLYTDYMKSAVDTAAKMQDLVRQKFSIISVTAVVHAVPEKGFIFTIFYQCSET